MLVDSHAHLEDDKYSDDRARVIENAKIAGLKYIINIGTDVEGNKNSLKIAAEYDNIYCTLGLHPHYCAEVDETAYDYIKTNASNKKVVGIGETGLDYFRNTCSKEDQHKVFRRLIGIARNQCLPLVIHSRDASLDTIRIIKEENGQEAGGVLHCFTGDRMLLDEFLKFGFYIAVGGAVTYPSAAVLREAVKEIPLSRLLLETDCPYLAPQSKRGQRNEPAFLKETAEKVAGIKGITFESVSNWSELNAGYLFKLGVKQRGKIVYEINGSLYINLTNRCSNHCSFCARNESTLVKGHDLAIDREPTAGEIIEAAGDVSKYKEVVFCGFGEPMIRFEVLKEIALRLKSKGARIRIDTNGQGNLIHRRNVLPELTGFVDAISVSLNAPDSVGYQKLCSSQFKEAAYSGVKEFIKEAKKYIPEVIASVVTVPGTDIEACRKVAEEELKVKFKIRQFGKVG
ncbi:MAG: radical SAM protein [Candidatus Firestonebacteria bacterium RIFOXYC2_FULL_39_67]|nr:MAG: radical SAM protein [Candidatus Firestonebacteria bacterium RIFOXYD2_FULL_39_29]OGF53922.1 MAG: radical SAM protein [Candidatus Firestonebacteria bacterium RIFOXYC2_FULL_39_67]